MMKLLPSKVKSVPVVFCFEVGVRLETEFKLDDEVAWRFLSPPYCFFKLAMRFGILSLTFTK